MLRPFFRMAILAGSMLMSLGAGSTLANSTTTYQVLTFGDASLVTPVRHDRLLL